MSVKKDHKKEHHGKSVKQASLSDTPHIKEDIHEKDSGIIQYEMQLSPITDRRSYDNFIKVISLRIYSEFEKGLKERNIERTDVTLVGFDLRKCSSDIEIKMADYVAVNSHLVVERAIVDLDNFAAHYMPRVMREMKIEGCGPERLPELIESKVQRDIMMEIRAIAIQRIPEDERFKYISKLKEL